MGLINVPKIVVANYKTSMKRGPKKTIIFLELDNEEDADVINKFSTFIDAKNKKGE